MGGLFSKKSKKTAKSDAIKLTNSVQAQQQQQEHYEIYDPNKYHDEAVEALEQEFKDDPETVILNLMLMSFMFFDDYSEEIGILANTASERGKKLNSELIEQHQKQLLMPDVVLESVNKKVKYEYSRGPKKGQTEPLVSQRMFILHDTIEIEDKRDSVDYSRIDKPCYRADIEESKENKGFVKVNLLGTSGSTEKRESGDSACSTTSSKNETWSPKNTVSTSPTNRTHNNDSGFTTESDYGYTRITAAKTPRRLQISEKDIYTNISQLPSKCITPVKVKNEVEPDSDSEEEEEDDSTRKQDANQPDLFIIRYYLNSVEFMSHFKDNVFPNYLGEVLDFTDDALQQAMSIPGAIYCDSMDDWGNYLQYEVLPAIAMPWPDLIAWEWPIRRRVTVWDRREKKPIAYKWPTQKMIDEAKKLNCVIIPKGFMPKKGENSKMKIEWEICFPKAERYLEFRMSHAQMRLFLYLITLYKTFIEPKSQKQGLLIEHIRHLMFWECEANYKAWPEDKLGTKLKLILKTLYDNLSKHHLSHYFIRQKNVLENIPGRNIVPTLEVINHIIESPVPYVLYALKHIRYAPGKFYPEPNFEELYNILTSDNNFLPEEAHLIEMAYQQAKLKEEAKRRNEDSAKKSRDKEQNWNRRYLEQQRHANKKKLPSNNKNTDQTKNLTPESTGSKGSMQSLNLEIPIKKRLENIPRKIQLLTFFIQHFLQIAKRSLKISSTTQTLFYLKQAWYLTKLLESNDIENAISFQNLIKEEEELCQRRKVVEPKIPSTPKRNSTLFTYQTKEILQVKGKEINIINLSKTFNANTINEQMPSTSGVKKKTKRNIQAKPKAAVVELQVSADIHSQNSTQMNKTDEDVQLPKPTEPKEIKKAVSFRERSNHVDIGGNDDDDSETTSL